MIRKLSLLCGVTAFLLCLPLGTARATLVALSIKFGDTNSANIVSSSAGVDAAGTGSNNAGVFANWNTLINKTTLNGVGTTGSALIAGNMVLSNGAAATGVKVDGWKDAGGPVTTPNSGGFDVRNSYGTPSGSAGDVQLMAEGPRMNAQNGQPSQNYGSIELSGLLSLFPNGFTVRSYQAVYQVYPGDGNPGGQVNISATPSDFTSGGLNTNYTTNAIDTLNWSSSLGTFNNNYFTNGYYETSPLITGQDLIVITNQDTFSSVGGQFSGEVWNGIQIIGDIPSPAVVPEPSSLALAAFGLAGLGLVVCRKKFRRA